MIEGTGLHGYGNASAIRWRSVSFYALFLYFAMLPFSDAIHRSLLLGGLSDLVWALGLLTLSLQCAFARKTRPGPSLEAAAVAVWVVHLLVVFAATGSAAVVEGGVASQAAYDLRVLLQPVPVFMLVAVRGVNRRELNALLCALVAMAPLSIVIEYRHLGFTSIGEVVAFHARGLGTDYNTYVPFTTFPVFAALYLLTQLKGTVARVCVACALTFTALFIVANPSRQSMLFLLLGIAATICISKNVRMAWYALIVAAVIAVAIEGAGLADTVTTRFFSAKTLETTRTEQMQWGLATVRNLADFATGLGAGISRSDGINPHNNYIFTVMRFGLLGTIFMFFPFVRALILSVAIFMKHKRQAWYDRNLAALIVVALLFTLVHSFFGYPNMDALNGPIVWFGLGLSVVYRREVLWMLTARRRALAASGESGARTGCRASRARPRFARSPELIGRTTRWRMLMGTRKTERPEFWNA